jgi:hypothetical protein
MIEVSWTRLPPSCVAMLPHELIVDTTAIGLLPAVASADVVGLAVEHPVIINVAHSAAGASTARRPVRRAGL